MYYEYICLEITHHLEWRNYQNCCHPRPKHTPILTNSHPVCNLEMGIPVGTKFWFHQLSVEGAPLITDEISVIFWIRKVHQQLNGNPPNNSIFHGFARVLRAQPTRENFQTMAASITFRSTPRPPTLFGQGSWHKFLGNLGFHDSSTLPRGIPIGDSHLRKAPLI